MFNVEIDDLAEKPYIPPKNYFNEFVANVLHNDMGIFFLTSEVMEAVEAKNNPRRPKSS